MLDEYTKARLVDDLMKYPIKTACIQLMGGGLITVETAYDSSNSE